MGRGISSHDEKVRRAKKKIHPNAGSTKGKKAYTIDNGRTIVYLDPGKSIDEWIQRRQEASKPKTNKKKPKK